MALLSELHIDRLSIEDRLLLVEEIWDSIAQSQTTVPLTDSQQQELERRLRDHEQNPNDVVAWEEVKAATLARLSQRSCQLSCAGRLSPSSMKPPIGMNNNAPTWDVISSPKCKRPSTASARIQACFPSS